MNGHNSSKFNNCFARIQAARYQMVIMFLIAATSGTGIVVSVTLASAMILDSEHRLRPERLVKQAHGEKMEKRIHDAVLWVIRHTQLCRHICIRPLYRYKATLLQGSVNQHRCPQQIACGA